MSLFYTKVLGPPISTYGERMLKFNVKVIGLSIIRGMDKNTSDKNTFNKKSISTGKGISASILGFFSVNPFFSAIYISLLLSLLFFLCKLAVFFYMILCFHYYQIKEDIYAFNLAHTLSMIISAIIALLLFIGVVYRTWCKLKKMVSTTERNIILSRLIEWVKQVLGFTFFFVLIFIFLLEGSTNRIFLGYNFGTILGYNYNIIDSLGYIPEILSVCIISVFFLYEMLYLFANIIRDKRRKSIWYYLYILSFFFFAFFIMSIIYFLYNSSPLLSKTYYLGLSKNSH